MIAIIDFNELLTQMITDLNEDYLQIPTPPISGFEIKGYVLVANEKHLVKRLGDKSGVWIAVTIPSADPEVSNEDNVAENNIVWMFIIEKVDPGGLTEQEELEHYHKTQMATTAVKNWLRNKKLEGNQHLEYLNLQSLHTDPEYQFGGWNGWSINFNFDTDGY